jgi:RNA polymerase sigma-70 factor, ECF subfamily
MTVESPLGDSLLAAIPSLRAFAISLCGNRDRADDLVQDTLVKAWSNMDRFERGTNLNAWLFTILRNSFFSEHRKRVREVEDADGSYAAQLTTAPDQLSHLDFDDLRQALLKLPPDQREALLLVGAQGFSYEDAASICGCAVGTIKSRVNRARSRLAELLRLDTAGDLEPDGVVMAALQLAA